MIFLEQEKEGSTDKLISAEKIWTIVLLSEGE